MLSYTAERSAETSHEHRLSTVLVLIFFTGIVLVLPLARTVQVQTEEKVKETVKGLLEGTTKPQDLPRQGKELLEELFDR